MPKNKSGSSDQLRDKAVKILFESLSGKYSISLEKCYEIYDKMQKVNQSDSDRIPRDLH